MFPRSEPTGTTHPHHTQTAFESFDQVLVWITACKDLTPEIQRIKEAVDHCTDTNIAKQQLTCVSVEKWNLPQKANNKKLTKPELLANLKHAIVDAANSYANPNQDPQVLLFAECKRWVDSVSEVRARIEPPLKRLKKAIHALESDDTDAIIRAMRSFTVGGL